MPDTRERREYEIDVTVRDASGDVVVRARPRWVIGPATVPERGGEAPRTAGTPGAAPARPSSPERVSAGGG